MQFKVDTESSFPQESGSASHISWRTVHTGARMVLSFRQPSAHKHGRNPLLTLVQGGGSEFMQPGSQMWGPPPISAPPLCNSQTRCAVFSIYRMRQHEQQSPFLTFDSVTCQYMRLAGGSLLKKKQTKKPSFAWKLTQSNGQKHSSHNNWVSWVKWGQAPPDLPRHCSVCVWLGKKKKKTGRP